MSMNDWKTLYEVKGPKCLLEMTAAELKEAMKDTDTVILSFGALENHGAHLPLGADWFQANVLIRRVYEELAALGHKSIPGFPVPFGTQTNQFERQGANLFGNVYLNEKTFIDMAEDLILHLHEQGFERFVLCLNHSENHSALNVVAKDLANRFGIRSVVADWVPPHNDFWPTVLKNAEHQGHGGEDETACVMAAVPELVHLEDAKAYYAPEDAKPGESVTIEIPLGNISGYRFVIQVTDYAANSVTYKLKQTIGTPGPRPTRIYFDTRSGRWFTAYPGKGYYWSTDTLSDYATIMPYAAAAVGSYVYVTGDTGKLYVAPADDLDGLSYVCRLGYVLRDMAYDAKTDRIYGASMGSGTASMA